MSIHLSTCPGSASPPHCHSQPHQALLRLRTLSCAISLSLPGALKAGGTLPAPVHPPLLTGQFRPPCWRKPAPDEPFSAAPGGPAWSTGCESHVAVQGRLDVLEETVEKTVEHLEVEVKGLLGLLEELAQHLPAGPLSPAPDLLGDGPF
ncbi:placenta-specific protein 9 isoform X2 [Dasypus novemcinctus]|uniref:placenta-specific protein 9 isoform X2 n=1 Tax=Dasypus novemcinctus TaxID=9361 RepID=UPI00265E2BA0|nr:placenta-specific protein 9 isoform X2 [Dasypus novemcinctus]